VELRRIRILILGYWRRRLWWKIESE